MDKNKKTLFKEKLFKERERISDLISKIGPKEEGGFMDEYSTELSSYDNHPADLGTEVFMMEQDKGMKNRLKETLYQIDNSIEKLELGEYGKCNNCGKEIKEERLNLIPYANLCIECSKKNSPQNKKKRSIWVGIVPDSMIEGMVGGSKSIERTAIRR